MLFPPLVQTIIYRNYYLPLLAAFGGVVHGPAATSNAATSNATASSRRSRGGPRWCPQSLGCPRLPSFTLASKVFWVDSLNVVPKRIVHSVLARTVANSTDNVEVWAATVGAVNMTQQRVERQSNENTADYTAPKHCLTRVTLFAS